MEGFKASSSCGRPFSPPLTLKIELPYKREHDFQDFSEPQNDAFWAVILTPFCSQHPAKDCSSAPPPRAKTSPSALRECRIPPEVNPSLLWQSPWDHFAASEATLAAPGAPFATKIPPKVTSKWLSKAILTSLFNDFGNASFLSNLCVGCEHWAYLSVEMQDMCLVESQDICRVETQDMCCVES